MTFLRRSYRRHSPIWMFVLLVGGSISLSSCSVLNSRSTELPPPGQFSPQQISEDPTMAVLGGFNRSGSSPFTLLQSPPVKQELNLTENQATKLSQVSEEAHIKLHQTFSEVRLEQLKPQQRIQKLPELHKKLLELTRQNQEAVARLLQPTQLKRFKEIALQVYGFGTMTANQFTEELKLTSEQKQKLVNIHEKMLQEMSNNWQVLNRNSPDMEHLARDKNHQVLDSLVRQESERSLAILTPEQRNILETLKGEKFVLDNKQLPLPPS